MNEKYSINFGIDRDNNAKTHSDQRTHTSCTADFGIPVEMLKTKGYQEYSYHWICKTSGDRWDVSYTVSAYKYIYGNGGSERMGREITRWM